MKKNYIYYIIVSIIYIILAVFIYSQVKNKIEPEIFIVVYAIITYPTQRVLEKVFLRN